MTTTMRSLVVLGAGTAGTMVVNKLRHRLHASEWRITVVDKDDLHDYQPGYLFLPFGLIEPGQVRRSRHRLIADGIEIVFGDVDRVDPLVREVSPVDGRTLGYDELVIASGTTPRPDQTPGMLGPEWHRSVGEFYTYEGAMALRESLDAFSGGRLVVHVTEMPIKCPVAPLEFTFLVDDVLRRRGLRDRTEIVFVTPLDGAFTKPVASRELGHLLADKGITVETDFMVEHVDQERRVLVSYDEREVAYDQLITIPLNMGADFVAQSGLGDELNYVPVDKHTMRSTEHPAIWVLGDASTIPTSKAGSVAHFSVEVFVDNFLEYARGEQMTHSFDGHANCFVESGGGKAMLLDFNYDTEPLTGTFPLPRLGPMTLLTESRANHLGKPGFRHSSGTFWLPGGPPGLPRRCRWRGRSPP